MANETHNTTRATRRRVAAVLRLARDRPSEGAAPSPEGAVLAAELHQRLVTLIRLAETDRLVLACRYLLEMSEAETEAAMACARGTVKSRLSRALRWLRGSLSAEDQAALEASPA
ncbi:MAG: RNA polymerase sigma factor [Egibacteraceae bacterium]